MLGYIFLITYIISITCTYYRDVVHVSCVKNTSYIYYSNAKNEFEIIKMKINKQTTLVIGDLEVVITLLAFGTNSCKAFILSAILSRRSCVSINDTLLIQCYRKSETKEQH